MPKGSIAIEQGFVPAAKVGVLSDVKLPVVPIEYCEMLLLLQFATKAFSPEGLIVIAVGLFSAGIVASCRRVPVAFIEYSDTLLLPQFVT